MLTKNVQFSQRPEHITVHRIGQSFTCRVDIADNIREKQSAEGDMVYIADVYSVDAGFTPGLKERIANNYDTWLQAAKETVIPQPTIQDVVDAMNALAEVVMGGEM